MTEEETITWCDIHDHLWQTLRGLMAGWVRCGVCGEQIEVGESEEENEDEWD